jgi:serpin B
MKKMIVLILSAIVLLGLMACALPIKQPVAAAAVVQSNKPRETSPATDPTDIDTLANGNSAFAFNLYQALKDIDGNLFYSPYSISEALAMTYGGARGDTEK